MLGNGGSGGKITGRNINRENLMAEWDNREKGMVLFKECPQRQITLANRPTTKHFTHLLALNGRPPCRFAA